MWDLTSVGEENETFFIRVWKPLTGSLRGKVQRGQYLLAVGLELLQMVTELDTERCVSEEAEP